MRITFRQLSLFVAVAERENISQGAKASFLSQPAASMTLAELEKQLGHPLFDRVGKKLVLNENGLKLYPRAVELMDRARQIEALFKQEKSTTLTGYLKIGASSTIGNYVMPSLIAQFVRRYPNVKITQKIANSQEIIHDLEKFTLDVGFIESTCSSTMLDTHIWKKDELIIFASPKHPLAQKLAQKESLTRADLDTHHWILREPGSGTREILEHFIQPKQVLLEIGSTQAIKKIVADNLGLSCASRFALEEELKAKTLVELPINDLTITRDFLHLTHKAKYQTEMINAFNQVLK